MLPNILFYILLFSFSALCSRLAIKRKNVLLHVVAVAIPVIIAAIRYRVGTDYSAYILIYNDIHKLSLADYLSNNIHGIEFGYFVLVKLASLFRNGPVTMFALSSILTVGPLYYAALKSKISRPSLAYFLMLCVVYPLTFNGVRQGIAMGIFTLAYVVFAQNKKPLKFLTAVILASLFHSSAFLFLPTYFIAQYANKNKGRSALSAVVKFSLLIVAVVLVAIGAMNILVSLPIFEKYAQYVGSDDVTGFSLYTINTLVLIISFMLFKFVSKKSQHNSSYLMMLILMMAISTAAFNSNALYRITLYLYPFVTFMVASFPSAFSDYLGRKGGYILCVVFGVVYFGLIYGVFGVGEIVPYEAIKLAEILGRR
ncbi:MAG: EpsG family protein [Candidatus Nanosyncoccaceae bacterium]|jgi:hypothetical protein